MSIAGAGLPASPCPLVSLSPCLFFQPIRGSACARYRSRSCARGLGEQHRRRSYATRNRYWYTFTSPLRKYLAQSVRYFM